MLPVVAIVGRPNVGKSALFNRLTKSREALVADIAGLTRDRKFGRSRIGDRPFIVVDTGGIDDGAQGVEAAVAQQAKSAIAESDIVLFVVDGRAGLVPQDGEIADLLRRTGRKVLVLVNKAEGLDGRVVSSEFFSLGFGTPCAVSAMHGDGIREVVDLIGREFPDHEVDHIDAAAIRVAVVGRPNVGKSTLINTWVGEERVIAFDLPGTTRDSIEVPFERNQTRFVLVDTAGLRKRGKVFETIEKVSVVKTLQSLESSDVAVLVVDASIGLGDQDAHILGYILEAGRAAVIAINKIDAIDLHTKALLKDVIARKLRFAEFVNKCFVSARKGQGVERLLGEVKRAYESAQAKLSTPRLTRALSMAVERQNPPRVGLVRPKLRYAHQGGSAPPTIVIHGNALESIPASYTRYLEKQFREVFKLVGTPLLIHYRSGTNPYHAKPRN